jgi:hypothetical protein
MSRHHRISNIITRKTFMKPSSSLTRTCTNCGQQKPLSAFLQLAGAQGAVYGNICSSCRKTQAENPPKPKDVEGSSTSSTGVRIDSKTKVQDAKDKRNRFQQTEENYFEQREEKGEEQVQKTQKDVSISKDEKKHRENYIEKRTFLDSTSKAKPVSGDQIFGSEEHKAKEGKLDFAAGPVDYSRVAGTIKTQSSIFLGFKTLLGNATPIGKTAPIVIAAEKAIEKAAQEKKKNKTPAEKAEPDAINDYVNKLNPRSRS